MSWIRNQLKDRKQRAAIHGENLPWKQSSQWGASKLGLRLGLVFSIVISDLEKGISREVVKFADVTELFRSDEAREILSYFRGIKPGPHEGG